jgi:signal peptidase I
MRSYPLLPRFLILVALSLSAGGTFASPKYKVYYVASGSMEKTLRMNDRVLVDRNAYVTRSPKRGDVVIFEPPQEALLNARTSPKDIVFLMRVVAVPGEVVEVRNGKLFINGTFIKEPHVNWIDNYRYDVKVVNGTVYTREMSPKGEKRLWSHHLIAVPIAVQAKIDKAKPEKVPADQYFILGDSRGNANDSHVWGFLQRSAFRGQAINVFSPLPRRKPLR